MTNHAWANCVGLYTFSPTEKFYRFLRTKLLDFTEIDNYIPSTGKILDVGCGYGFLTNYLALKYPDCKIYGIDIDEKRITKAAATIGGRKNIHFSLCSVEDSSFTDFDTVLMLDMLHYLPYPTQEKVLNAVADEIKPGGLLVLRDPDTRPLWRYTWNYMHEWFMVHSGLTHTRAGRLFFRSSASYSDLLGQIGFSVQTYPNQSLLPYSDMLYICTRSGESI